MTLNVIKTAKKGMEAYLESLEPSLVFQLKELLGKLPFKLDQGFEPALIQAIHFEYEPEYFDIVCYPIGVPSEVIIVSQHKQYSYLYPDELKAGFYQWLAGIEKSQASELEEQFLNLTYDLFEQWFNRCWDAAKIANPAIRGFLSVHDTSYITDLDRKVIVRDFEIEQQFKEEKKND